MLLFQLWCRIINTSDSLQKEGIELNKKDFNDGVWPVVLTPFSANGAIDFAAYGRLLDFYAAAGVNGLFAVCLSSELYELSADERLELARFTLRHTGHRLPVVACAGIGANADERLDSIKAMADTGVDAVVIPACLAVAQEASDAAFTRAFTELLDRTGNIRLGVYECPRPYHRLIPPEVLGELARCSNGRLAFIKDTCCDAAVIREKLAACAGTGLKNYNANLTTCLESLRDGAAGYSGTSANFYPELLSFMCANYRAQPELCDRMQQMFNVIQHHVNFKYPRSAKKFIQLCGVDIGDFCRVPCPDMGREEYAHLRSLHAFLAAWKKENGL